MSPTFQLTNFTKKEFLSFDGLYAGYGGGLGTGGTALELLYSAQTLLRLDDKLYAHHYAIEDWRPHKQGLPAEFQAAIKQLSGRWAGGDKIGFVERSDWEMRYNGEESAASVKARAEHTLQSTFEDTRMNGQMTMDTLKNEPDFYPKKGWRDVTCEVLLGAAAYQIAMDPKAFKNPFSLIDRSDPTYNIYDGQMDCFGLARRVEAMRQMAIPLAEAHEQALQAARDADKAKREAAAKHAKA